MKKALILEGRVIQVEDVAFPVAPPLEWVDCPDDTTTAWTYADGLVSPPVPSLEDVYNSRIEELQKLRDGKYRQGINFGGVAITLDELTEQRIMGAYVKASSDPNFSISNWRISANTFIPITNEQVIALGDAVTARLQACFDNEAALSAALAALDSADDIMNFNLQAGWP